jgi:hypothetical protein
MRQAFAGMLWSKQYYYFDANQWLDEHGAHPLRKGSKTIRNKEWFHMVNDDIISMPDIFMAVTVSTPALSSPLSIRQCVSDQSQRGV